MDKEQLPRVASVEKIIEDIKQLRDNRTQFLMRTPDLMTFMEDHYNTFAISPVKLEFIKRDLKTLMQSPLDLVHYSSLILKLKDQNLGVIEHYTLIDQELKTLIEKYGFEKPKPF